MTLDQIKAYWELGKPRLTAVSLLSAWIGYYLAARQNFSFITSVHLCLGSFLAGMGANALNQFWERESDSKMERTRIRPLPEARLKPREALIYGLVTSVLGVAHLWYYLNNAVAATGLFVVVFYVLIYTPLKSRTAWNTIAGAIPGALPPVMGWFASGRGIEKGAVSLFFILFFWQLPHFFAISWNLRRDYAAAGSKMISVGDENAKKTKAAIFLSMIFLILASISAYPAGLVGPVYVLWVFVLGIVFLGWSAELLFKKDFNDAKGFFLGSIFYLLMLFILMIINRS